MTPELFIEQDIVRYLSDSIKDYQIECFSGDPDESIIRAQKLNKGLVVVAHSSDSADYGDRARNMQLMTIPFAINLLSNSRKDATELFELLHRVRTLMLDYQFSVFPSRILRHLIHPVKFPNASGIFVGEIDLEIRIDLFSIQKLINEN